MKKTFVLTVSLLLWVHKNSANLRCTNDQECCANTLRHASLCRDAELHCSNWENLIQTNFLPLPESVLRKSPWNVSCSYEEHFCPLTFQCINKTEACTYNTTHKGSCSLNSTTPWGEACQANHTFCPILASCIPYDQACSFKELAVFLQDNTQGYFGITCQPDEVFCPGTQTCVQNQTVCDYNSSLSYLNISCPGNASFCPEERSCTIQPCSSPVYSSFSFNDSGAGWKKFCDNFQYICPKIISIETKCKPIADANGGCEPSCGPTPVEKCYCPYGHYKCDLQAACFNDTRPCGEQPAFICPSSASSLETSSVFWTVEPSPSINDSVSVSPSVSVTNAPPFCNSSCKAGFSYCHNLSLCIVDGYGHCGNTKPYCSKGMNYCISKDKCISPLEGCSNATSSPMQYSSYSANQSNFIEEYSSLSIDATQSYEAHSSYFAEQTLPTQVPHSSVINETGTFLLNSLSIFASSAEIGPFSSQHSFLTFSVQPGSVSPLLESTPLTQISEQYTLPASSMPLFTTSLDIYLASLTLASSLTTVEASPSLAPLSSAQSLAASLSMAPAASPPSASASPLLSPPSMASPSSAPSVAASSSLAPLSPASSASVSPLLSPASSATSVAPQSLATPSSVSPSSEQPSSATLIAASPSVAVSPSLALLSSASSASASQLLPPASSAPSSVPPSSVPPSSVSPASAPPASVPPSSPPLTSRSSILSSASLAPSLAASPSLAPASSVPSASASPLLSPSASVQASLAPASLASSSLAPASSASASLAPASSASALLAPASSASASLAPASSASASLAPASLAPSEVLSKPSTAPVSPGSTPAVSLLPSESINIMSSLRSLPSMFSISTKSLPSSKSSIVPPVKTVPQSRISVSPTISTSSTRGSVRPSVRPFPVCRVICQLQRSKGNTKSLGETYPPLGSSEKIAIAGVPQQPASWSAFYNSKWHNATSLTMQNALVLGHTDKFRVDVNSKFYGEVPILIAYLSPATPSGSRINVTAGYQICYLIILFIPNFQIPNLHFNANSTNAFRFDIECQAKFPVRRVVDLGRPNLTPKFMFLDHSWNTSSCVRSYRNKLEELNRCMPHVHVDFKGSSHLLPMNGNFCINAATQSGPMKLNLASSYLCPNATGKNKTMLGKNIVQFLVYRLKCQTGLIHLPYIAENSMPSQDGYLISTLNGFQSGKQGLAVVGGKASDIGYFQYQLNADKEWQNISIAQAKEGSEQKVIFLRPSDKIRFISLRGASVSWSKETASQSASLSAVGWDLSPTSKSNTMMLGKSPKKYCSEFPSSTCCSMFALVQLKISGCDKKPGSTMTKNSCNECTSIENNIYKKCNDCHAVIDDCEKCTNGSTGRKFNYLKDCKNECDKNFLDGCGNCLSKQSTKNFTDCNGVCNGKAIINNCGHCVLGNTGRPSAHGMDFCGVCGGNSSSCVDCNGIPNGGRVADLCGKCLFKNDQRFGMSCVKLGAIKPRILPNNQEIILLIEAAGVANHSSVSCAFVAGSIRIRLEAQLTKELGVNSGVSVKVLKNAINPGKYALECTFTSNINGIAVATKTSPTEVKFFDPGNIIYTGQSPLETVAGVAFKLTISGSGFFYSPYLVCVAHGTVKDLVQKTVLLSATYNNSTSITCNFPAIEVSAKWSVTMSFSTVDRVYSPQKKVDIDVFVYAANITSAKFRNNLAFIDIQFSKSSRSRNEKFACSDYFADVSKLGANPKCTFKGKRRFVVKLGKKATVKPSDSLTFKLNSIKSLLGNITKYAALTQSFAVSNPDIMKPPIARIFSSPVVGACSEIELIGRSQNGGGGRALKYYWSVDNDPAHNAVLTNIQRAAVEDYNKTLKALPITARNPKLAANASLINIYIKFTLTVVNFLDLNDSVSKTISRININIPTLYVGAVIRSTRVSQDLEMTAKAYFDAGCLKGGAMLYTWSSKEGVSLASSNAKQIFLPKGTLQSGLTYTFTVTASSADDLSSSISVSIKVTTIATELNPILIAPSFVGINDLVFFDPSKSTDPDQTSKTSECKLSFFKDQTVEPVYIQTNGLYSPLVLSSKCTRMKVRIKDYFLSGKCYSTHLHYKKGSRSAIKQHLFCVQEVGPPLVYIRAPTDSKKFDISSKLVLKAEIVVEYGPIKYEWACKECQDFNLNAIGVAETKVSGTRRKRKSSIKATLVIAKEKLPEGTELNFTLTAHAVDNPAVSGSGNVVIFTNSPPSSGTFTVSPSIGNATSTKFTLEAFDFVDDADDMPLTYIFGFVIGGGVISYENGNENTYVTTFPQGETKSDHMLEIFVIVKDKYGASTRYNASIKVLPVEIPDDRFSSETNSLMDGIEQDPVGACLSLSVLIDSKEKSKKEQAKRPTDKDINVRSNFVLKLEAVKIPRKKQGRLLIAVSIKVIFFGLDKQSAPSGMVLSMSNSVLVLSGMPKSSKRRRRAASPTPVEPITASEAETYLGAFQALDPSKNDSNTVTAKTNFLALLSHLMRGMCRSVEFNMPATIAKTSAVVLQSFKVDFGEIGNNEIKLGCTDCEQLIKNASYLQLGQSLANLYSSFVCNPNENNCTGACIGSAQMPLDYLSTSVDPDRLGPVVLIKLLNPDETYAYDELPVTSLANPMLVRIPLQKLTSATYVCKLWDSSSENWVESGVNTVSQILATVGNSSYVKCAVNRTGYLTIMKGPPAPTTTPATSASTTTLSTAGKPRIKCQFSFLLTCSDYFNSSTKSQFENSIRSECAKKMKIPEQSLENVQARCGSIIVNVEVVGLASNATLASVNSSVQLLKGLVESGSLAIKIHDGRTITASTSGFIIIFPGKTTTTPLTSIAPTTRKAAPKPVDKGLSGGAIAGIVIGCIAVLAAIAALAYLFVFKKHTKQDPTVDPNQNAVELDQRQGTTNPELQETV